MLKFNDKYYKTDETHFGDLLSELEGAYSALLKDADYAKDKDEKNEILNYAAAYAGILETIDDIMCVAFKSKYEPIYVILTDSYEAELPADIAENIIKKAFLADNEDFVEMNTAKF